MGLAVGCADQNANEGTCHLGTIGCQCLEGTCEIGFCSDSTGRCVLEEDDGTSGGMECPAEAPVPEDCPCNDEFLTCAGDLVCVEGVCTDLVNDCSDLQNNRYNCGECGRPCPPMDPRDDTPADCIGGKCEPVFGDCFTPDEFASCDEYCASKETTCNPGGCGGRSVIFFASESSCAVFDEPALAIEFCGDPLENADLSYRCCCDVDAP